MWHKVNQTLIGIGVPRKLIVPLTLLFVIELMISIPQMIGLSAMVAWIPHREGNGILTWIF